MAYSRTGQSSDVVAVPLVAAVDETAGATSMTEATATPERRALDRGERRMVVLLGW
jgi:hypothetical protein